jgi:hypothetical protein
MIMLKTECLSPKTGKPYIISGGGGRDNSVQGLQVRLLFLKTSEIKDSAFEKIQQSEANIG